MKVILGLGKRSENAEKKEIGKIRHPGVVFLGRALFRPDFGDF
jgi:hypothetical protein